jgi:hypothetical protein
MNAAHEGPTGSQLAAASTWKRALAWVVDFFVFFALWALLNLLTATVVNLPVGLAFYLLGVAIPLTAIRGQTVGQIALGVVVVDTSGRCPPGPLRAAAHVALSLALGPLNALLFILLDWFKVAQLGLRPEAGAAALKAMPGRLLHERIAGTAVIDSRHGTTEPQLENWAKRNYHNALVASAAANAAAAAVGSGSNAADAAISGHCAAVIAGGEYRCRPDRTGIWIALWIVLGAAFGSMGALGLAFRGPTLDGLEVLVLLTIGPAVGLVSMLLVRRNSGYYLTANTLKRLTWLGKVAASFPRSEVRGMNFVPAGQGTSWSGIGIGWAEFDVEHPERYPVRGFRALYLPESAIDDSRQSRLSAWLIWWSDQRSKEFERVFDSMKPAGGFADTGANSPRIKRVTPPRHRERSPLRCGP